jgi:F-type H+-transporting ATPase subunit epsilon
LTTAAGTEAYFIDGGFAQVESDIVSVLTARALPAQSIPVASAQEELATALSEPSESREQQTLKSAAVMRARGKLRTALRQQ